MMKKLLFCLIGSALMAGCGSDNDGVRLMKAKDFATTVDGKEVGLYTLTGGDLTMQVTNYGGRVVALWVPDRNGKPEDIVLGYDNIQRYLDNNGERFLGAPVGRYANRIAHGRFTLDDVEYALPQNNNGHTLHGGLIGIDRAVWDVKSVSDNKIELTYVVPDGQDGFPGNLAIDMIYELTPKDEFIVRYIATTDAPTVVNLSHHSFFNLKGEGKGTITDHVLALNSSNTTPVDEFLIPTGEIAPVDSTPFDFRSPTMIGKRIDDENQQLAHGKGYDHNWVLDRQTDNDVEIAATLWEPNSGRFMEVWTDQPGLQFYSGNFFNDNSGTGKYKRPLKYRESLALETQKFPDSPNHPNFPSTVLRPGETYEHTAIYKFSIR